MAEFDPTRAVPVFDPSRAELAPPPPPRGPLGEIGTGLARGAVVDLPTLAGQALQYVTTPGGAVNQFARGMVQSAQARGERPGLTLQPGDHNVVTNALASGAEMLPSVAAVPLAVGAGLSALPVELPALAVAGGAAAAGGAMFGAQAGQETLDKAAKAGVSPEVGAQAARLNAASTMALQTGLGMVGGKMLGAFGNVASRIIGRDGASLAGDTLSDLMGQSGVVKPFLKTLPASAAEAVGLNATQAATSAQIERSAGIDNQSPVDAAVQSLLPTLGLTAMMTPLGLVARGMQVRSAQGRTAALNHPGTDPAIRTQLADQYAARIAQVDPQAAATFRANAQRNIMAGHPLDVNAGMFDPGFKSDAEANAELEAQQAQQVQAEAAQRAQEAQQQAQQAEEAQRALETRQQATGEALRNQPPVSTEVADRINAGRQAQSELTDLHTQVKQGLVDAGIAPAAPLTRAEFAKSDDGKDLKGQALARAYTAYLAHPDTARDLMARDAGAFDALQTQREAQAAQQQQAEDAAASQPRNAPPAEEPPRVEPAPPSTAMAEAMQAAMKKRDETAMLAARDAEKERQNDATANITKGAQQAEDAAAGKITPNANAPKGRDEIVGDWHTAMVANDMDTKAQARVPFEKRIDALGLDKMDTHQEQVDAVAKVLEDKKVSQGMRDRLNMLLGQWAKDGFTPTSKEGPTAPPETKPTAEAAPNAAAVATAAPASETPATAAPAAAPAAIQTTPGLKGEPPPETKALGDNLTPLSDRAQALADNVAQLRAELNDRVHKGETLPAPEQQRQQDLAGLARTIQPLLEGQAGPRDAEWIKSLEDAVQASSKPYKNGQRLQSLAGPKVESTTTNDMGLLAPAAISHKASDVLGHIAETAPEKWARDYAARLQKLVPDTTIYPGSGETVKTDRGLMVPLRADWDAGTDNITVHPVGANIETILHEATHAATAQAVHAASQIERPRNQQEAQRKAAYQELEAVRRVALDSPKVATTEMGPHYGLSNALEFVAELHSNAEFRDFLKDTGGPVSLWGRAVNAVRRLLGMPPREEGLLERAMDASAPFFSDHAINSEFDRSPAGASHALDMTLQKVGATADATAYSRDADPATAKPRVLKAMLPWQTASYIRDRVLAVPELVRTPFAQGVVDHVRAFSTHDAVHGYLQDVRSRYTGAVERMLRGMDTAHAVSVQREMQLIGGEASRVGFDFRKNGRDNLAENKSLGAADKPYIDEMHRRYTQMQRLNPDAAKLLDEGERLNRRDLIERTATIAANLMDERAGRARVLQAELAQMTPTDARHASAAEQVRLGTLESTMAAAHSKGLDIMDPSLQTAKMPSHVDAARFHNAGSAELGVRLERAFADARALPEGLPLRDALGALQSIYSAQEKHPYFALGRSGDYFVKAHFKDVDARINAKIQDALKNTNKVVGDLTRGDQYAFFRLDSADEAEALHAKLVAAGEGHVVDTARGRLADRMQEASSAVPALRSILGAVDDLGANQQVKEAITRQVLQMLPETAARSAQMGRRGIPGYNADFLSTYAKRMVGAVHDTAGIYTSRRFADAADKRQQGIAQLSATGSMAGQERAQLVDDEINKRYANMMKAAPSGWVSQVNSMSHSFYLGLSPAFFIRTLAQPWHRGIPFIGSKFGYVQSMAELARSTPVAAKLVANSVAAGVKRDGARGILNAPVQLDGLGLSPADEAFVKEAYERGKFSLGESEQLMRAAVDPGTSRKMQDALRMASASAQYAEMSNRFVMGLTAFRLAQKRPGLLGAHETPTEYALKAIEYTMDDFSPYNTARAIGKQGVAGKLTPLFAQFQNYNLQTMQQIARTVHDGFFGQDKSVEGLRRASEAKREFAGLMATTAVISGALGLPFANALAGVYNNLMTDKDHPEDVRVSMRNWAADTFGKDVGGILTGGLPHAAGVDSETFGLQNLLPGSDFLASRLLWKDRATEQVRGSLGPAVSLGMDLGEAASKMSDGYWLKGIEAALPVGLRSFYKTAEMTGLIGPGGYTDSKGNPIPLKAGAGDIAWRALGFQSAAKAEQATAQQDMIVNAQLLKHRRDVITDEFIKGTSDPVAAVKAQQDLQAFNALNPMQPLTGMDIRSAVVGHARGFAMGQAIGLGSPVSRRNLPVVTRGERFAAMPQP